MCNTSGNLAIHQDARIYLANLAAGVSLDRHIAAGRHAWFPVLRVDVQVDDCSMKAGDGLAISDKTGFQISSHEGAEVMRVRRWSASRGYNVFENGIGSARLIRSDHDGNLNPHGPSWFQFPRVDDQRLGY